MAKVKNTVKKTAKYKIKITKNGPYLVSGGVPLSGQTMCLDSEGQCHGWQEIKKYPVEETYALCRCGRSANMPFCDGTHGKVKFESSVSGTGRRNRRPRP
jgi:CDGSH-type Zn-finger protein